MPSDFNFVNYKILNPDLNNLSENELIYHYIKNGREEKRLYLLSLPADFNIYNYRLLNSDLNNLTDNELINHYLKNGKYENRPYLINLPSDFNFNNYKILNPDLSNLSDIELKCHYINNGKNENRQYIFDLPDNFNCYNYKILNQDLINFTDDKLIYHYIKFGRDEKREYILNLPNNFDIKQYRLLNEDLNNLSDDELIYHFIKFSKEENRQYILELPDEFNCSNYKILNPTLYNLSDDELIVHFLNFKNIYKTNISKNFNYNIYKLFYEDCKNDLECEIHYYNFNLTKNYDKLYFIKLYILYYYENNNLNVDFNNISDENLFNFVKILITIKNISFNDLETYIMLEKYFLLNNIKFISFDKSYDLLLNNPEEHLRYLCYRNLNYLKNKKVKYHKIEEMNIEEMNIEEMNIEEMNIEEMNIEEINSEEINSEEINSEEINTKNFKIENKKKNKNINNKIINNKIYQDHNETVLIEFDILYHLEFIIRNMIIQFPKWKHTIVCCEYNYLYILNICNNIFENINQINIIKLDKNININYENYSSLLTTSFFWNLFTGKYILLYKSNFIIYKTTNFDKFLNYDYIGTINNNNDNYFSIRNRKKMIEICNNFSYNDYVKNAQIHIPEWIFFINKLEIELPIDIVYEFLSYNIKISDENYKEKFNKIIIKYYCSGLTNVTDYTHRFGWNNILLTLYINDIITYDINDINDNNNTQLIDICEKYFHWNDLDVTRGIEKWVGILHLTYNTPEYLNHLNIKELLNNTTFILRLSMCTTLVSMSNYLNNYISNELSSYLYINKEIIYHPVNLVNKTFNINAYLVNNNKKIIQIGQQMRIFKTFLHLKFSNHKKIWLSGNINLYENIEKLKLELNVKNINLNMYNIEHKYIDNDEFDNLLLNNIIFIHLYDSSANNTVLEAISYKTPIVINRCEAVEEYLGKDYPLYFDDINELNDDFISNSRIKLANDYLLKMDNSKFSYKIFNQNILELI